MPVEITNAIDSLLSQAAAIPPALVAIILLAGPTTIWLIYRLIVVPRRSRYAGQDGDLLWICEHCRSANELRHDRCYRCGHDREATLGDLHVVDGESLVALARPDKAPSGPGVPVGPGRPDPVVAADPVGPVGDAAGPGVPVGPGKPEVSRPRRAVTSSPSRTTDAAIATREPGD